MAAWGLRRETRKDSSHASSLLAGASMELRFGGLLHPIGAFDVEADCKGVGDSRQEQESARDQMGTPLQLQTDADHGASKVA